MKKSVILLAIMGIFGFIFLQYGNGTIVASDHNRNELSTIAKILEEKNAPIEEWAVHSREHLTSISNIEDVQKIQAKLMKEFPKWDWSTQQENGKWKSFATNTSNDYQETIQIMATLTNEQTQSYLIYEVKGTKWNQQTKDFFGEKWNSRLSNIFREKPTIFSCMKADISDKIVKSLTSMTSDWLEAFHANEIESLHESEFASISATSPLFAEAIQTKDEKMNLQLAIRSNANGLGAKTTLVVGTPIITIEY